MREVLQQVLFCRLACAKFANYAASCDGLARSKQPLAGLRQLRTILPQRCSEPSFCQRMLAVPERSAFSPAVPTPKIPKETNHRHSVSREAMVHCEHARERVWFMLPSTKEKAKASACKRTPLGAEQQLDHTGPIYTTGQESRTCP